MLRLKEAHEIEQGDWCHHCGVTVRPMCVVERDANGVDHITSVRRACDCDPIRPMVWVDD
jgi:hypothetical protein